MQVNTLERQKKRKKHIRKQKSEGGMARKEGLRVQFLRMQGTR